jgi:hypothetical protein
MINGIYNLFKPNKQKVQSTESNEQKVQIPDEIVDAVVFIVRVTLLVGFAIGAICMGIIDRIMN